jgi:hypothetical protein
MEPSNNTDVIPDPVRAYADEAIALLAHVDSVEDHLDDLTGGVERSRNAAIADAHKEIGSALKQADIYATLAIAEAIDKIREALR